MVSKTKFVDIPKILKRLLGERYKIGKALLDWAKEGRLTKSSCEEFCKELNCGTSPYYDVLRLLKNLSLIYLEDKQYHINKAWCSLVVEEWIDYLLSNQKDV